jgi:hypothetical protein
MSPATTNSNGHSAPAESDTVTAERRQTPTSHSVSPEVLIERHVENARRQLADARETLKAARRRVVQLEDALGSWERFAAELRRGQALALPPPPV